MHCAMNHFKALTMSCASLITMYILTVTVLPLANGQGQYESYRISQHPYSSLPSRAVVENQNVPARPVAPSPESGNDRYSDIIRRLQSYDTYGRPTSGQPGQQGWGYSNPASISYNPGYQTYNPNQIYPGYNRPDQGYQIPGYFSNPGYNTGYYQGYQGQRTNPNPVYPWQRYIPGYNTNQQNQYNADYRRNTPQDNTRIPDFNPIISSTPDREPVSPNMRPAPSDDGLDDRSREAQNNAWSQFLADQIGGPSFWDKTDTGNRRGQPPTTTTTTTPPPTTVAPTRPAPRNDPNFFKPDGSLNTNRLGMVQAPVNEDTVRDRTGGNDAYNLFMSLLGRNFFTDTANRHTGRSSEEEAVPRPKAPTQIVDVPKQTSHPPMFDKPYEDIPKDFLDEDYIQKTEENDTMSESENTAQRSGQIAKRNSEDDQEKFFTSDGKMFQSEIYTDKINAANTKLSSVNGRKASQEEKEREGEHVRTRRQAGENDDNACQTPSAFASCHFYPHCFQEVNRECVSRDSFIGDDVSSICSDLHALATSTESDVLRTFLSEVIACVDTSLLEVLESPSCDDVTDHLSDVLLTQGEASCLAKASNFCVLLETPVARYNLAKVFAEPKGREDFMLRLLVNLGTHTNMCQGPGANIFLLDLLSNVMHRNTTYTMPNGQPMPVFEP